MEDSPPSSPVRTSSSYPRSSIRDFAEKLPFLHQPSPRGSRDWSRDHSRRTSMGLPTPGGISRRNNTTSRFGVGAKSSGHRRQLSLSSFSVRGVVMLVVIVVGVVGIGGVLVGGWTGGRRGGSEKSAAEAGNDGGVIPPGESRMRDGREVFWWEQFDRMLGYYQGRDRLVSAGDWVSEQEGKRRAQDIHSRDVTELDEDTANVTKRSSSPLVDVTADQGFVACYIDEKKGILPPKLSAYSGIPKGFPAPLFGSHEAIGLRNDVCYDRINRFGPYGLGSTEEGGLGIKMVGDSDGRDTVQAIDYRGVQWGVAQDQCIKAKKYTGPRSAFVIRTWHGFKYTPHHIMMLRALISELVLTSGGKYTVHFLIHVQDDSIPIWASDEEYDRILKESLPEEFAGMGSLWSVAQMKLIYPPPFPESIVNFSGSDIYKAYRSLHFALQYFAQKHPEFEYFWEWEMDIRVTGSYLELLEQVSRWADKQEDGLLWETSSKFFIPGLFDNSYSAYVASVAEDLHASNQKPISGPQLPQSSRLTIPGITDRSNTKTSTDLITFSPMFPPEGTKWAFHDDITGYPPESPPPTRAALITASRVSRRLLITMHHETFSNKHTMFPEMFPASVALHYGYRAVYAPLPVYFDRDWPPTHADLVFNNAIVGPEDRAAGMDHGNGRFHGDPGSVFGPGEHVFRGATWYSNAGFAGYLWRRWLGREDGNQEVQWESPGGGGGGRMCLPMMVLHPIKDE